MDIIERIKKSFENGEDFNFMQSDIEELNTLAKKAENMEKFVKKYYNTYLKSREIHENMLISNNDQFFLYADANFLLGEPNGKKLD